MKESELSYISPEGYTVFTSNFHRKRGTCCKSSCLHCPYGFTLKKNGLTFRKVVEAEEEIVKSLVGSDLNWRIHLPENIQWILIKDRVAGIMIKNHIIVKEVFLLPQFQHQGLDKDLIESYYFI
jgi:hypothetical protein